MIAELLSRQRCGQLVAAMLIVLSPAVTKAQEIQPVTHVAPPKELSSLAEPEGVQFAQLEAQVGDRVTQQVAMELELQTTIVQAGQLAQQQDANMKRGQRREVEVLEVAQGRVRRARVSFPHSRHQLPNENNSAEEAVQPVEGKTYLLTRKGKQLQVRYPDGTIPPQNEFEIVFGSMHSLGLPNPLAKFLLERTFQVGEKIELPKEIAQGMLGLGSELGEINRFELTLTEVKEFAGQPCAHFQAKIVMGGGAFGNVSLEATGPIAIRLDSCRTVLADFTGPLEMSSVEQTSQGDYQHQVRGTLRVAVRSDYGQ